MKGRTEKRPKSLAPVEQIERAILLIRGHKVMVDADLATLYGVATKVLNQAVTRNERRFPPDFMFRMTESEKDELVTNCDRLQRLKHSTTLPRVFTEQGVAMLSSVLNSDRAVQVNIEIMRAFVRLRQKDRGLFSRRKTQMETGQKDFLSSRFPRGQATLLYWCA
jgi:hypothetical protein